MSDPKKPRRRYLQFRLRTFLVVLTLVCLWFGWLVNRSNQQRKAVAWVLQMGGSVRRDGLIGAVSVHGLDSSEGQRWS